MRFKHKEIMHYAQSKLRAAITNAINDFQQCIKKSLNEEITAKINVDISYIRNKQ